MLTSFNHLEVIGNHHVIFSTKICVLFISLAMQNPSILSISIYVLKPLVVEGVFQTRNLDFLHSIGWMLFGHKGIYNYRSIKQKMGRQKLGTMVKHRMKCGLNGFLTVYIILSFIIHNKNWKQKTSVQYM